MASTDGVQKTNLLSLNRPEMQAFFTHMGEKPFRATQVMSWIHHYGHAGFEGMTNLSKELRHRLANSAEVRVPEIVADRVSTDGTRKWLLRLVDGNCIETVFIPEKGRGTLCISSQVGCTLNCTFCATGYQGYNRNLTTDEIVSQIWVAYRCLNDSIKDERMITNVVFMGMGEPLYNIDNVARAIDILLDDMGYGLSRRRVTVSTAGVVPAIDRLREICDASLAISLHAPYDALRTELVPLNRKYPIASLLAACRRYVETKPGSKITFEYVLLAGVNDSPRHAEALVSLIRDIPAKVNLIPFNPFSGAPYTCPDQGTIDRFRDILMAAGLVTVTRRTRGDDIDAACGQLAGQFTDRTRRRSRHMQKESELGV